MQTSKQLNTFAKRSLFTKCQPSPVVPRRSHPFVHLLLLYTFGVAKIRRNLSDVHLLSVVLQARIWFEPLIDFPKRCISSRTAHWDAKRISKPLYCNKTNTVTFNTQFHRQVALRVL